MFWTMRGRTSVYGYESNGLWQRALFEWDSLCSHSALTEGVDNEIDLTPDQLDEIAAMVMKKYNVLIRLSESIAC